MLPDRNWAPSRFIQGSALLHAGAAAAAAANPACWAQALAAVAANHVALAAAGMLPRSRLLGPNLVRLPGARRHVALTFDDGPDPEVTPRVLDLLDRHGVTASFFCIGDRARAHPGILRDIVRRGHSAENHTMSHPNGFAFYLPPALRRQVGGADDVIAAITGRKPRFFRPPMGFRGPPLDYVLARAGLRCAAWTRRGFDTGTRDPALILRRLATRLGPGDILLLHDGNAGRAASGRPAVLDVLPALLDRIAAAGLTAVSLDAATATAAAPGSPASAACAST